MKYSCFVPHPPLIVPGIGNGREIPGTRRAYEQIVAEINSLHPDTVIIISPHSILYSDYFHIAPGTGAVGNFSEFGEEKIRFSVSYDMELASLIGKIAQQHGIPAGPLGAKQAALDHGVMVPLYFLKAERIVRISLSGLSLIEHYRLGMCISEAINSLSRKVVVAASGDMSHKLKADGPYGFAPEGPEHDAFVTECIRSGDFRKLISIDLKLSERAAECGLRSLIMMLGTMDGLQVSSRVLSYEGPFGVGYLTADFIGEEKAPGLLPLLMADNRVRIERQRLSEDDFVRLARQNVEHFVRTGEYMPLPKNVPLEMISQRAGIFVSIKKHGQLRGCIGTTEPVQQNIAMEILKNSVSAACYDPRFEPIIPEELTELTYSVDILSPAEPIDGPAELDTARYGVIVSHGHKHGLLLPNLDGVDTVEQQIEIARQKAGIGVNERYSLERFEVVRHV